MLLALKYIHIKNSQISPQVILQEKLSERLNG